MIQQGTQNFFNLLAWWDFETVSTTSCSLRYTGIFSSWEKIISSKRTSPFFWASFFVPLPWQKNSIRKHRNVRKCYTFITFVKSIFGLENYEVLAKCVLDGLQKSSPRTVTVYGSSIFETLRHRVLLIVLETYYNPGQTRGKCKEKKKFGHFVMRFFFPCSAHGSYVVWFDQTHNLSENPTCY